MAVTITVGELAVALRLQTDPAAAVEAAVATVLTRHRAASVARVEREAPLAPPDVQNEAVARMVGYLYDAPAGMRATVNVYRLSGAQALLAPWRTERAVSATAPGDAPSAAPDAGGPASDATARELASRALAAAADAGRQAATALANAATAQGTADRAQLAADAAEAAADTAQTAANMAQGTADANRRPMPATANEARVATSATLRSWSAALIRTVVESIVPSWARETNAPTGGGAAVQSWAEAGNDDDIPTGKLGALVGTVVNVVQRPGRLTATQANRLRSTGSIPVGDTAFARVVSVDVDVAVTFNGFQPQVLVQILFGAAVVQSRQVDPDADDTFTFNLPANRADFVIAMSCTGGNDFTATLDVTSLSYRHGTWSALDKHIEDVALREIADHAPDNTLHVSKQGELLHGDPEQQIDFQAPDWAILSTQAAGSYGGRRTAIIHPGFTALSSDGTKLTPITAGQTGDGVAATGFPALTLRAGAGVAFVARAGGNVLEIKAVAQPAQSPVLHSVAVPARFANADNVGIDTGVAIPDGATLMFVSFPGYLGSVSLAELRAITAAAVGAARNVNNSLLAMLLHNESVAGGVRTYVGRTAAGNVTMTARPTSAQWDGPDGVWTHSIAFL